MIDLELVRKLETLRVGYEMRNFSWHTPAEEAAHHHAAFRRLQEVAATYAIDVDAFECRVVAAHLDQPKDTAVFEMAWCPAFRDVEAILCGGPWDRLVIDCVPDVSDDVVCAPGGQYRLGGWDDIGHRWAYGFTELAAEPQ